MDSLMREIARNAADYAVGKWGLNLPKGKQMALWSRYHDSVLAALMSFEEVNRARTIRARAVISEN